MYSHEPEPDGSGTLYGGAEVEPGMEAEVERSILCTVVYVVVVVVVVGDGECTRQWEWLVEDERDGNNRVR